MADNTQIPTKTIQKILGHSSHRTTEIYLYELGNFVSSAMDSISERFIQIKDDPHLKASPKAKKVSGENSENP